MKTSICRLLVLGCLLNLTASAQNEPPLKDPTSQVISNENWPRFRGPTGQGISTEKDLPFIESKDASVLWKIAIPGEGWSSPIVWDNRVFVTATTADDTRCHVLAVDRRTGQILWNTEVFQQQPLRKESKNSYATPTPVTDGQLVYAVFGNGGVAAVNMDGTVAWTNLDVSFYSRHGLGSSPIVYGNLLIMPYDGSNHVAAAGTWPNVSDDERVGWQIPWEGAQIVALDTKTGKRVWTAKRGLSRIAHVTPLVVPVDAADQLISPAGDRIQGFNPKTGELIWSVYSQGEGVTPSPAHGNGLLFTASGFERTTLRTVKLSGARGDVTDTHIAWEQRKGVPNQPSLLFVAPHVYAISDGGIVSCYQAKDGEIVYQERVGGNHSASPVYANNHIYFLSEEGEITVIKAGPKFEIVGRKALEERAQASIAISQGNIFARTQKHLHCLSK